MHRFRSLKTFHLGLAGWILTVSLLLMTGMALVQPHKAAADSCDPVNIIRCGLDQRSLQSEINTFQASYGNGCNDGHCDLKQVYRWAGATNASVAGMNTSNTKAGTLFRNGDIKVNGNVVGTDSWVAARFTEGAGFVKISSDAWARKTTTSFADASKSVIVHFSNGSPDFAVITDCGNAVKFTPHQPTPPPAPQPHLVCVNLDAKQVGSSEQFNFTARADATHTTITKYVFDFGDGHQQSVPVSSQTASTQHAYSGFGQTLQARVTVFSSDFKDGRTSADCTARVILPQKPALRCVAVVPTFTSNPLSVKLTASDQPTRTTITSYTFSYSDGTQRVIPTSRTSASDTHTFAQNNTQYSVSVTVAGRTADGRNITADSCRTSFTTPGPNECKPGVPVGSPQCTVQPCEFNPNLPSTDVNCKAPQPTELLNTGPSGVIGAAAGITLIASVARYYYLRHKFGL
jgi:hypothetical protein